MNEWILNIIFLLFCVAMGRTYGQMSIKDSAKGLYISMLLGAPITFIIVKMHVKLFHSPPYLTIFITFCFISVYLSAIVSRKIFRKKIGLR
jgi:hypothetical protein